jgi:hypothetical protein
MNVERAFSRSKKRAAFSRAVAEAGRPPPRIERPLGPNDRVIARNGDDWFSARVTSLTDAGYVVSWDGDSVEASVDPGEIALGPPYAHQFVTGQFALLEPPTPGVAWSPVRVRGVGEEGVLVEGESGATKRVSARPLVPLVPDPASSK